MTKHEKKQKLRATPDNFLRGNDSKGYRRQANGWEAMIDSNTNDLRPAYSKRYRPIDTAGDLTKLYF